ncbi:MAG: hypothetical protein Q7K26_06220 [bacterium]|nr:hypothetical protein [bacterium]
MLTQDQRNTFRLALASFNAYSVKNVEELDINHMLSDDQIVETRETIENFFEAKGRKLNRRSERPEVPFEQETTLLGIIFKWDDVQARKGARRGTLYVMDFGVARAAFFDGEA